MRCLRTALSILGCTACTLAAAAPAEAPPVARAAHYREVPQSYAGVGLFAARADSGDTTHAPGGIHARLGGMLDPHWGVEARLARGLWHETEDAGAGDVQVDVDSLAGLYLTSRWAFRVPFVVIPAVPRFFVQGHAGLAALRLKAELETCVPACTRTTKREHHEDFSWGIGAGLEVQVPKIVYPVSLSLEYMDYGDKDDLAISAVEAGVQFMF